MWSIRKHPEGTRVWPNLEKAPESLQVLSKNGTVESALPWLDWNIGKNLGYLPSTWQFVVIDIEGIEERSSRSSHWNDKVSFVYKSHRDLKIELDSFLDATTAEVIWSLWKNSNGDVEIISGMLDIFEKQEFSPFKEFSMKLAWACLWENVMFSNESPKDQNFLLKLVSRYLNFLYSLDKQQQMAPFNTHEFGDGLIQFEIAFGGKLNEFLKKNAYMSTWKAIELAFEKDSSIFAKLYSPYIQFLPAPHADYYEDLSKMNIAFLNASYENLKGSMGDSDQILAFQWENFRKKILS